VTAIAPDADVAQRVKSEEHSQALKRLFCRIGELSSLPSVAGHVLEVAESAESNAADLLEVVQQDPTLAIRILRTANSSFYGLGNEVADLQTAIAMLGFVEVRNLALTVYVARLCEEPSSYGHYSRENLWQHMVSVGTIARVVSRVCKRAEPEEAYLAGLLHDLGILLVDQHMHPQVCQVIDRVCEGAQTTDAEQQVLTFDHTDMGAYVARQSNFPERIAIAIQYHHRPHEYRGRDRDLLDIVVAANYLVSRSGCSSLGIHNVRMPPDVVYSSLGLHKKQLSAICDEMDSALESAKVLAEI